MAKKIHKNQIELREKKVFKSLLLIAWAGLAIFINNPTNNIGHKLPFYKGNLKYTFVRAENNSTLFDMWWCSK